MHTHTGTAFDNHLTMTFNLLTSGSMHAERMKCTICQLSSVLIAQVVFLSECEHTHTDRQTKSPTPLITLPMHRLLPPLN